MPPVENLDSPLQKFSQENIPASPSQNREEVRPVSVRQTRVAHVVEERSEKLPEKVSKRKRGSN